MKTAMKKLLSLTLVAILLASAVPFQALAAETEAPATEAAPAADMSFGEFLDGLKDFVVENQEEIKDAVVDVMGEAADMMGDMMNQTTPSEPAPTEPTPSEPVVNYFTVEFINEKTGITERKENLVEGSVIVAPTQGAFVSGYSFLYWKAADGTTVSEGANLTVTGNKTFYAVYQDKTIRDENTLNVFIKRYVGSTLKETVPVHSVVLQTNDNILEYLGTKKSDFYAYISAHFPNYTWSGTYYNYYGYEVATDNIQTTNGTKNVYLNIYSNNEAEVLIYCYYNSTSVCDRLIELKGFERGETATYNAVVNAVHNVYPGASVTMFDAEGWADCLAGKSNTSTHGVRVKSEGTTKIYVYLTNGSGSGSSSSSSSNADTSNPKTGDNIMMAASVMALSATALAVAFFYDKKRRAV